MTAGARAALATALAALSLGGCSDIGGAGNPVVELDVVLPTPPVVEVGDTIQLTARALDRNGDSVDAAPRWRAADTTVAVDSVSGRATGLTAGLSGRIQAAAGTLVSDFINLTVLAHADTLALPNGDTVTVTADSTATRPLAAAVLGGSPPAGLAARTLIFRIVSPVFGDPGARTVEFSGGVLADTAVTGGDGLPSAAVMLTRITGVTAPQTVVVQVTALHPSGRPVAGSGQQFTVTFQ